jgi:hypothetical protein
MAILNDQVRDQLRERFATSLSGPVQLTLFTKPDSGRLILPSGFGCATCNDARELAEELVAAAPLDLLQLRVVDVSAGDADGVTDVPTLTLGPSGEPARISWKGLPSGFEFATVVDAVERASSGDLGLSAETLGALEDLIEPVSVMVFATPT